MPFSPTVSRYMTLLAENGMELAVAIDSALEENTRLKEQIVKLQAKQKELETQLKTQQPEKPNETAA